MSKFKRDTPEEKELKLNTAAEKTNCDIEKFIEENDYEVAKFLQKNWDDFFNYTPPVGFPRS